MNCHFNKLIGCSFSYVGCLIIYSFVDGIHFLQTYSFSGDKIAEFNIEETDEIEFVQMKIVKNDFHEDFLILCSKNGDFFFFELPFLTSGKKIKSTQKIKVTSIQIINKRRTVLIGNENGSIDILNLINKK